MKTFRYIVLFSFIFLTLFIGCTKKENNLSKKPQSVNYQERINEFVNDGLDFKLGESIGEIIKNLGNPKNIKVEKIKNVYYPDVIDEINKLFYNGLYVEIYKATEGNKEILTALSVMSYKFKVKWGLNVGASKDEIKKVLGNPSKDVDNVWSYVDSDGYEDEVRFYFKNDKVNKIEWSYYID
jgi:hypothetical protein